MILEIYNSILYLFDLALGSEVLWITFPLLVATVVMLVYFEKYKEERPGWNTCVANSLVLLFISMILFRYIYSLGDRGIINFVTYLNQFIVSLIILFLGFVILFLNFKHFLPQKIAEYMSSPLTLNLVAYIAVLYVYSEGHGDFDIFIALLILFIVLIIILNLIKIVLGKLFLYLKKMKEAEKIEEIVGNKKPIDERKKDIKKTENAVKKGKKKYYF